MTVHECFISNLLSYRHILNFRQSDLGRYHWVEPLYFLVNMCCGFLCLVHQLTQSFLIGTVFVPLATCLKFYFCCRIRVMTRLYTGLMERSEHIMHPLMFLFVGSKMNIVERVCIIYNVLKYLIYLL